jgi:hypothetical protein
VNLNQETLGRYLIRERELRRVSAGEIALRVKTERCFIDALEKDDFDIFTRRSEATAVLMRYAAYLNVDREEVLRRFAAQWKLTGGVKRYPKLTYFADGDPGAGNGIPLKGKGILALYLPRRKRLPVLVAGLVFGLILFFYLPPVPQEIKPNTSPTRSTEYKAPPAPPAADRVPQPAVGKKGSASIADHVPLPVAGKNSSAEIAAPRLRPAGMGEKSFPPPKSAPIIGNRDSKRYHLPGMKYYDKVRTYHRVVFQSERQAINAGYTKGRE